MENVKNQLPFNDIRPAVPWVIYDFFLNQLPFNDIRPTVH
jgi:hypothetical protein